MDKQTSNPKQKVNIFYKPMLLFGTLSFPVYMIPFLFRDMFKGDKLAYFLYALYMGFSAYLMIPYNDFDLTRHYEHFELMRQISFDNILTADPFIKHYFFNVYMWLVGHAGLPREFVPFSFAFTKFMFYFATFEMLLRYYLPKRDATTVSVIWIKIIFLLLIIGLVRFVGDTSGLRNSLAFATFLYAIMAYYLEHKRFSVYLLLVLAMGIHLSVVPLVLLFFVSNIFKFPGFARVIFIISAVLLLSGKSDYLFYTLMAALKPYLVSIGFWMPDYMAPGGKWGAGYFANQRFAIVILEKYIMPSAFYLATLYLLIVKDLTFKRIKTFLYLSFSFVVLVSVSRTMLARYAYFYEFLFVFVMLTEFITKPMTKFKKLFLLLFIASVIAIKMAGIYRYRIIYIKSWAATLYTPASVLLLRDMTPDKYLVPNK